VTNVGDGGEFCEGDNDNPLAERIDDDAGQVPEELDSQRRIVRGSEHS